MLACVWHCASLHRHGVSVNMYVCTCGGVVTNRKCKCTRAHGCRATVLVCRGDKQPTSTESSRNEIYEFQQLSPLVLIFSSTSRTRCTSSHCIVPSFSSTNANVFRTVSMLHTRRRVFLRVTTKVGRRDVSILFRKFRLWGRIFRVYRNNTRNAESFACSLLPLNYPLTYHARWMSSAWTRGA